ncbi:hypothetical protein TSOC_008656 [Tetrabaena socialis]|uniref:Peptidase M11 gametolysin domain-containing protein n=1 Tax=Tetrabaena socialis TaxID=47790 RepID=A0A2J7ZXY1_9CHLO|nr:hypothetical protein TSOC_008656 [Tetrabaena socialis]|eukprot:PNH05112.1 hypothetical protein TSOC_008656 [Tetrabaena socialis]
MGLFHSWSWANMDQYGDSGSIMGLGPAPVCWNAPQGQALGLDQPIATLTADTLPAGSWQTLRLPPAFVSETNYVAIQPSWMSDPLQRKGTLYLTYRLARGAERGLKNYFDGRINIHSYVGELALTSRNYTLLLGNITEGSQWPPAALAGTSRYPWRLLVVAVRTPRNYSSVDSMIATAQVCRFNTKPEECGTPPPATRSSGAAAFTTRSSFSSASTLAQNVEAIADDAAAVSSPPEADQMSAAVAAVRGGAIEAQPFCGDGVCTRGAESVASCAVDCCDRAGATCGDGRCDAWAGESCASCPEDCARVRPDGSGDVLPFPLDFNGHIQFTAHDTLYTRAAGATPALQWYCCGGGPGGDGCAAAGCAAAAGSGGGGGSCRASCADPGPLARLRSLLWRVAST